MDRMKKSKEGKEEKRTKLNLCVYWIECWIVVVVVFIVVHSSIHSNIHTNTLPLVEIAPRERERGRVCVCFTIIIINITMLKFQFLYIKTIDDLLSKKERKKIYVSVMLR